MCLDEQLSYVPEACLCPMTFFLPSPGRTDAKSSHPSAGSPHPESHRPLPHVFPYCRPHAEGKARPVLEEGPTSTSAVRSGRGSPSTLTVRLLLSPFVPSSNLHFSPPLASKDGVCTQGLGKLPQFAGAELSRRCRLGHPASILGGRLQRGQLQLLWWSVNAAHACGFCGAFCFNARYHIPEPGSGAFSIQSPEARCTALFSPTGRA